MSNDLMTIRAVGLFEGLSDDDITAVQNICRIQEYKRGDVIIRKGEDKTDVFFILSGSAVIFIYASDISHFILKELSQEDFFGEISAIDGESRTAWVLALTDVVVASIPGPEFLKIVTTRERVALNIIRHFSKIVREGDLSPRQRICAELLHLAGVGPRDSGKAVIPDMSVHAIMARLCIAKRSDVAAVLGELRKAEKVSFGDDSVTLEDIDYLRNVVREGGYEKAENEQAVLSLFNALYLEQ